VFRLPSFPSSPGGSYPPLALTLRSHETIGQSEAGLVDILVVFLQ